MYHFFVVYLYLFFWTAIVWHNQNNWNFLMWLGLVTLSCWSGWWSCTLSDVYTMYVLTFFLLALQFILFFECSISWWEAAFFFVFTKTWFWSQALSDLVRFQNRQNKYIARNLFFPDTSALWNICFFYVMGFKENFTKEKKKNEVSTKETTSVSKNEITLRLLHVDSWD